MMQDAAKIGEVVVLLNSDEWLTRKKGRPFMTWEDRATILRGLQDVTGVISVDDSDGSVCDGIRKAKAVFPDHQLVFCNGGDRKSDNTPEVSLCEELGVELAWNIGGGKTSSSSDLLASWTNLTVERPWGRWTVLKNFGPGAKLKLLTVEPGKSLSLQKHLNREEHWWVLQGSGLCFRELEEARVRDKVFPARMDNIIMDQTRNSFYHYIRKGEWHQIKNTGDEDLVIIELQRGDLCVEEDIIRVDLQGDPKMVPQDLATLLRETVRVWEEQL